MSETTNQATPTAPSPAPTPEAPAKKAPLSGAQIAAKIRADMAAARGGHKDASDSAHLTPKTPPQVITSDAEPKPAEAQPERKFSHRDAAAALAAQRAERAALQQKQQFEAAQKELADLKAQLAKFNEDPHYKLAKDPLKYAEAMRDGKLPLPGEPEQPGLPPEIQELLAEAKARKEAEAKAAKDAERNAQRAEDLKLTKEALSAVSSDFPAIAGLANTADQILAVIDAHHGGVEKVDPGAFKEICKQMNDYVLGEVKSTLSNPAVVAAILADDKVKSLIVESLGLAPQQSNANGSPAKVSGATESEPRTLSNRAVNATPSRNKGLSSEELAAKIRSQFEFPGKE